MARSENFEGLNDSEILQNPWFNGINTDGCFYSLLKLVGKNNEAKFDALSYNLKSIEEAKKEEDHYCSISNSEIGCWHNEILRALSDTEINHKGDFIIVRQILSHDQVYFTFLSDSDFTLYSFDVVEKKIDHSIVFLDFLRSTTLVHLIYPSYQPKSAQIDKIPWVKYYNNLHDEKRVLLKLRRKVFQEIIETESKILSLDELENQIVKRLIENHHAPYLPEIYDPYNDSRTFKEYLDNDLT